MSSSASFGTSADLASLVSEEVAGKRRRRQARRMETEPELASSLLGLSLSSGEHGEEVRQSFYAEVDERMSRNSFEYPEAQADEYWLENGSPREESVSQGNVIGIRGFAGIKGGRQRASYNKLKSDYLKLQADHARLREQMEEIGARFKREDRKKDHDIEVLRAALERRSKSGSRWEDRLKKLESENETLRRELESSRKELEERNGNKIVMSLERENCRLRELTDGDRVEFESLKENCQEMEARLESIVEDRKRMEEEKNKEISQLMVELCRLQVYQPKLELILETERAIKTELQERIETLKSECNQLKERSKELESELNREKLRVNSNESIEINRLQEEVVGWQEKWNRLRRDKAAAEEVLRAAQSRVESLELRHQSELELRGETSERKVQNLRQDLARLELERSELSSKVDELGAEWAKCQAECHGLRVELVELGRALSDERLRAATSAKRLGEAEALAASLRSQLEQLKLEDGRRRDEAQGQRELAQRLRQQVEELRDRCRRQATAHEELRAGRDKELAVLRVKLNLERYNKQVALKGIEKELRASLRELEAMKWRFARRLLAEPTAVAVGGGGGGGGGGAGKQQSKVN